MKTLTKELNSLANPQKAQLYQRFFKTGKGEYGEGDIFLGITMPKLRKIISNHTNFSIENLQELLNSPIHEQRMATLLIAVKQFQKNTQNQQNQKQIYNFYINNAKKINNWDLVDVTCPHIVGKYLLDKKSERKILYQLAKSNNLWEKRISIISTLTFIRNNQFQDTLKISKLLLNDTHDLIHKAVGWMLREIGKQNQQIEENFLKKHYKTMPRTMLRYAIEKFDEPLRLKYLKGEI